MAETMWADIIKAFDLVHKGTAKRIDLTGSNTIIYRAGRIVRIDIQDEWIK
jgi:hypothetical protein